MNNSSLCPCKFRYRTGPNYLMVVLLPSWGKHDDVIKWKHFPRYWPFVRGIHWSPVNSPHKGQWRRALMFSLICARINGWVKQWWGWWFETLSSPLRHHCNESVEHWKGAWPHRKVPSDSSAGGMMVQIMQVQCKVLGGTAKHWVP